MDDGMISAMGQARDRAWQSIGILKTRDREPSRKALKNFLKLKGFDSSKYTTKLTPRGIESGNVKIFEVSIMPKPSSATGTGDMFGAPALKELVMGRRPLTPHGGQDINPDATYNENDVFGVMDRRDVDQAVGIGSGAGMYGAPAGALISGYSGATLRKDAFPYASGVGAAAKNGWQQTGISLGMDPVEAKKKFNGLLPGLLRSDPGMEFKFTLGPEVQVAKVQRRRMGMFWDTVATVPSPTDDSTRNAADTYKRAHPDAVLRIVRDKKRDYTVLKRPAQK
jgi:hypothetical protein